METQPLQQKTKSIPPKPPCNTVKSIGCGKRPFLFSLNDRLMVRDNFTTSTWLLLGAACQSLLLVLPIRPSYALAPALLLLSLRLLRTLLMCLGLVHDPYREGVIPGKTTGIYPSTSNAAKKPSDDQICVLLLPARSNHPLGMFAPGFKDLADHFKDLILDLDAHAPHNGFLGGSSWLNASDRDSASEAMNIMYFHSHAHLQAFAHGEAHRRVWDWWNRNVAKGNFAHIGLAHEVYDVPTGRWETMYVNHCPSNFAATAHWVQDEEGVGKWASPLVPAKGRYRTAVGRMGRSEGNDNEKYGAEPYANV